MHQSDRSARRPAVRAVLHETTKDSATPTNVLQSDGKVAHDVGTRNISSVSGAGPD